MKKANLNLERDIFTDDFTLGKLYLNDKFFCYTVEDKYRDLTKEEKIYAKTAIPEGTYKVIINMSNRFKKLMPLLLNVPNFEGIRIHSGNTSKDTEGCIIVGDKRTKNGVALSRVSFDRLMKELKKYDDITIKIR